MTNTPLEDDKALAYNVDLLLGMGPDELNDLHRVKIRLIRYIFLKERG